MEFMEIWAQYYTVGRRGYVDSDGSSAVVPTAEEARRLSSLPGQMIDIMWVNFSGVYGEPGSDTEKYFPVGAGESYIVTSRRTKDTVVFKPVSEVINSGRMTKYTQRWIGAMATGDHSAAPDRFDELVVMLD
jgi:hypothetical protein